MMATRFCFVLFFSILIKVTTVAQGVIYNPAIKSVKLFRPGDQTSFPFLTLNSGEVLQLEFDELGTRVKNFYFSFLHCNADWSRSLLTSFDYIKGFQSTRITTYRNSALANVKYVHYQATVPDRNSMPTKSGNYLLRVFEDNDTSKMAFAYRLVIVNPTAQIGAQVQQPLGGSFFQVGQKLNIVVQADKQMKVMSPSDVKVAMLQNRNWQTARFFDRPTLMRGNYFEYSDEALTGMEAMKEFRWLDLRSLRLLSDRMLLLDNKADTTYVAVKPESTRQGQAYISYRDLNGSYTIETFENLNPFWQTDYAYTKFTYLPANRQPFEGNQVYIFGELTNYARDTSGLMHFNTETGAYEKTLLLKQGYYNYLYATKRIDGGPLDFSQTEGSFWSTENNYTVLVYFRPFGARADECIGITHLNSNFAGLR